MDWRTGSACAAGALLGAAAWIALPAGPSRASASSGQPSERPAPAGTPAAGRALRFLLMDGCPGCEGLRPRLERAARGREGEIVLSDACAEEMERLAERCFRRELHGAVLLDDGGAPRWSAEGHDGMREALETFPMLLAGSGQGGGSPR